MPETKLAVSAKERYSKLEADRRKFLDRARECAALTIPSAMPPAGFTDSSELPTPYQSLGARGARNLASKLLLSLFPSIPFFNWRIDELVLKELGQARGETEAALQARERATATELDTSVFRPAAFYALLQLVICGNAVIRIPPKQEDRAQVYRLDQYVCRRDGAGNPLELIIQEKLDFASLPPPIQGAISTKPEYKGIQPEELTEKEVEVYTHCYLRDGMWYVYQEAEGEIIPGTDGKYPPDKFEFLMLRFSAQPGEDYGRAYVEEFLGDLDSLEALSETLVEGSAASAKIVFLVDPAGVTSLQVIQKSRNGDIKSGRAQDVQAMQVQKSADLSVAKSTADEIAQRLSYAFLLHSSVQRNGERVTAEEIRFMASELDDGLGGVYTHFAAEFQLPAVKLFEERMMKRIKGAGKLPDTIASPVIVAGLEAIGRGHEQRNLQAWMKEIATVFGPEILIRYVNPTEFLKRSAAAYSIDTAGLMLEPEQIQQNEQQAMMQQMIAHLGPQALSAAGGMGKEALKGAMTQPQAPQA